MEEDPPRGAASLNMRRSCGMLSRMPHGSPRSHREGGEVDQRGVAVGGYRLDGTRR
jgi:hypothetical protein